MLQTAIFREPQGQLLLTLGADFSSILFFVCIESLTGAKNLEG